MTLLVDSSVFIDAFDPESTNHKESLGFLENLGNRSILITMPAHGWFEVQCTFQRLIFENRFVGPIINGQMNYQIELIPIDADFIKKYQMADIPYTRAGDHIFVVIAKVNGYPLVTNDLGMIEVARQCGVQVFSPKEYADKLVSGT